MKNIAIECKNLKKTYFTKSSEVNALKNINLKVYENELLMLMGPSGSGKTTLLSVIAGILNFDSGDLTVLNNEIKNLSDENLTKFRSKNIGFVFQSFNLIPTLTSLENIMIPLIIQNINLEEAKNKAIEMLKKVDLEDKINNYPNELSGGEMQRVSIARGFIHNPKILLCDEPTSYLDMNLGKHIMQLLKTFTENSDTSIIVVTHDPRITDFATRIIEIEDGVIQNNPKN
jgi:putative ABC transport system ATP-binding protein